VLLHVVAIGIAFTVAVGLWNLLVYQAWSGLGVSPDAADLGTRFTALVLFGAWVAFERHRPELGMGKPTNTRVTWSIVPLVAMVLALNFEQAMFVDLAPAVLLAAVVAAFWEEFAFRGVLMSRLLRGGSVAAAWISSIGFGLLHAGQPDLTSAALSVYMLTGLGLSLSALRLGTGSIWPGVGGHLIINLSAGATVGAHPAAQSPQTWVPFLLGTYFLAYGVFLLSVVRPQATDETSA
jgi:membrane protease YdiL (CAAX protease family)